MKLNKKRLEVINEAQKYLGIPYVRGGQSPSVGFDCSGFVIYVFQKVGLLPDGFDTTADGLYHMYQSYEISTPRPAALKFILNDSGHATHTAIFIDQNHTIEAAVSGSHNVQVKPYVPSDNVVICDPLSKYDKDVDEKSSTPYAIEIPTSIILSAGEPSELMREIIDNQVKSADLTDDEKKTIDQVARYIAYTLERDPRYTFALRYANSLQMKEVIVDVVEKATKHFELSKRIHDYLLNIFLRIADDLTAPKNYTSLRFAPQGPTQYDPDGALQFDIVDALTNTYTLAELFYDQTTDRTVMPARLPREAYKDGATCIGDVWLTVPPLQITRQAINRLTTIPTVRTIADPVVMTDSEVTPYDLILTFADDRAINDELRHIIAMARYTPVVSVANTDMYHLEGLGDGKPVSSTDGVTSLNCLISRIHIETVETPGRLNAAVTLEPLHEHIKYHRTTDSVVREQKALSVKRSFTNDVVALRESGSFLEKYFALLDGDHSEVTKFSYESEPFSRFYRMFLEDPAGPEPYPGEVPYPKLKRYRSKENPRIKLEYYGFVSNESPKIREEIVKAYREAVLARGEYLNLIQKMLQPYLEDRADERVSIFLDRTWLGQLVTTLKQFTYKLSVDSLSLLPDKLYQAIKLMPHITSEEQAEDIYDVVMGILAVAVPQMVVDPAESPLGRETLPFDTDERVFTHLKNMVVFDVPGISPFPLSTPTLTDLLLHFRKIAQKYGSEAQFALALHDALLALAEILTTEHDATMRRFLGMDELTITLGENEKTIIRGMSADVAAKTARLPVITGKNSFQHLGLRNVQGEIVIETCDRALINRLEGLSKQLKIASRLRRKYFSLFDNILYRMKITDTNNFFGMLGVEYVKLVGAHIINTENPGWFRVTLYFIQDDISLQRYEKLRALVSLGDERVKVVTGAIIGLGAYAISGKSIDAFNHSLSNLGSPYRIISQYKVEYNGVLIDLSDEPWKSITDQFVKFYRKTKNLTDSKINFTYEDFATALRTLIKLYESVTNFLDSGIELDSLDDLKQLYSKFSETAQKVDVKKLLGSGVKFGAGALSTAIAFATNPLFGITNLFLTAAGYAKPVKLIEKLVGEKEQKKDNKLTNLSEWYRELENQDISQANIFLLLFRYLAARQLLGVVSGIMHIDSYRRRLGSEFLKQYGEKYRRPTRPYHDFVLPAIKGMTPIDPSFYIKHENTLDEEFIHEVFEDLSYREALLVQAAALRGFYSDKAYEELSAKIADIRTLLDEHERLTVKKYSELYRKLSGMIYDAASYNRYRDYLTLTQNSLEDMHLLFEVANKLEMAEILYVLREAAKSDAQSKGIRSKTAEHRTELDILADTFGIDLLTTPIPEAIKKICRVSWESGDELLADPAITSMQRRLLDLAKGINLVNQPGRTPDEIMKMVATYWGVWTFKSQREYMKLLRHVFDSASKYMSNSERMYPAFRVILAESDSSGFYFYDDIFETYAVQSILVRKKRDEQDIAELTLMDHFGYLSDINTPIDTESPFVLSEYDQAYKTRIFLKPGTRIIVLMGYGRDDDLPIVFQGTVTEVQYNKSLTNPSVRIVAHGDGGELNQIVAPDGRMLGFQSILPGGGSSGLSWTLGDGFFVRDLGDVATWTLKQVDGLKYLGKGALIDFLSNVDYSRSQECSSILNLIGTLAASGLSHLFLGEKLMTFFGDTFKVDDNIYLPYSSASSFTAAIFDKMTFDWAIYAKPAWEVLKELSTWRPNYIVAIRPYNEEFALTPYGSRSTVYLGPKDGYYKATDLFSNDTKELSKEFMSKLKHDVLAALGVLPDTDLDPAALWELGVKYAQLIDIFIPGFQLVFDYYQHALAADVFLGITTITPDTYVGAENLYTFLAGSTTTGMGGLILDILWKEFSTAIHQTSAYLTINRPIREGDVKLDFAKKTRTAWHNLQKCPLLRKLKERSERFFNSDAIASSVALYANDYIARSRQYKPVTNTHIVFEDEIITNGIITSTTDGFASEVVLQFGNEPFLWAPGLPPKSTLVKKLTLSSASFDRTYTACVDDDIPPELRVQKVVQSNNIDTNWIDESAASHNILNLYREKEPEKITPNIYSLRKFTRNTSEKTYDYLPSYMRVAINILGKLVSNYYTGELTIIGNPYIREYDLIYIWDNVTTMKGFIEADTVIHQFNENGFITRIKPALLTYVSDMRASFNASILASIFTYSNKRRLVDIILSAASAVGVGLTASAIATPLVGAIVGVGTFAWNWFFGIHKRNVVRVIDRIGRLAGRQAIDTLPVWYNEAPLSLMGIKKDSLEMHIRDYDYNGDFIDVIYDNAGYAAWVADPDRQHRLLMGILNMIPSVTGRSLLQEFGTNRESREAGESLYE